MNEKIIEDVEYAEWLKEQASKIYGPIGAVLKSLSRRLMFAKSEQEKEEIKKDIEELLRLRLPKVMFAKRTVLPAPSDELEGEINLGTIWQGEKSVGPFTLPKEAFCRHLLLAGQSGHGKTRLIYRLIDSLLSQGISISMFDSRLDGRPLLRKFSDFVVLPPRFPVNFMRPPPGMDVKLWWSNFAQISAYTWGIFVASLNYLQEHLDALYEKYESGGQIPTIHDLYNSVHNTKETSYRRAEYKAAVENKLYGICSTFQEAMNVEVGIPLELIFEHKGGCVVELHGLRPVDQSWVTEVMLSWFYFYQMYQGKRGEDVRIVAICDEAHRIWDEGKSYKEAAHELGDPSINLLPQQGRDLGIGFVWSTQQPSSLLKSCLANCLVKVTGQLANAQDIEFISEVMGLTNGQRDAIHKLKRGQWLVRISDYYTESPFYIETEDYPVERDISEDEVNKRLNKFFGQYLLKENDKKRTHLTSSLLQIKKEMPLSIPLSEDAWKLLLHVCAHPFQGMVSRTKELQFSWRKVTAAKEELIDKKLVIEKRIRLTAKKPVIFWELTDDALRLLEAKGLDTSQWKHISNVSFEHLLPQILIRYHYQALGYESHIEVKLGNGKRIDILTIKNDTQKEGIEIELNPNNDQKSKLLFLEEIDILYILSYEAAVLAAIRKKLAPIPERVKLQTIREFLINLQNSRSENSGDCSIYQNKPELNR